MAFPDYPPSEDAHVYTQQDGWVVAYYMRAEPASKVVDWLSYSGSRMSTTKLHRGLSELCNSMGLVIKDVNYFDFRYPAANKMLILIDGDTFKITIPSELMVYEKSFSHYSGIPHESGNVGNINYAKLDTELGSGPTYTVSLEQYWCYLEIDGESMSEHNSYFEVEHA